MSITDGTITEAGLRQNINVGIQYIASWLRGTGAAAIFNLMEDAATAEISRSQVWQWLHSDKGKLADDRDVTADLYAKLVAEELDDIKALVGEENYRTGKFELASRLFDQLVKDDNFSEFLTLSAYDHLA